MIFRAKQKTNFTIVPNKSINDDGLSLRSKGLLLYLLSKPDNWNVNLVHLASVCNEGKSAIRVSLNELIEKGYIKREQLRDDTGKMTGYQYDVYDTAKSTVVRKTDDGKPASGKPDAGNRTLISTDSNKNIETSNSTTNVVQAKPHGNDEITLIVKGFETAFGIEQPAKERKAAQWFRTKYGVETTINGFMAVAQAQKQNSYIPRPATLTEFYRNKERIALRIKEMQNKPGGLTEITF